MQWFRQNCSTAKCSREIDMSAARLFSRIRAFDAQVCPGNSVHWAATFKVISGLSAVVNQLIVLCAGKSIILIDDSIVRGTTIGQLVKLLKENGAKEVHIRCASPALKFPCYMGINIPTKEELIANHMNAKQLAENLGADSLVYLSIEGLKVISQRVWVWGIFKLNKFVSLFRRRLFSRVSKRNKRRKALASLLVTALLVWMARIRCH